MGLIGVVDVFYVDTVDFGAVGGLDCENEVAPDMALARSGDVAHSFQEESSKGRIMCRCMEACQSEESQEVIERRAGIGRP